jgi:hypothetical protein
MKKLRRRAVEVSRSNEIAHGKNTDTPRELMLEPVWNAPVEYAEVSNDYSIV